MNNIYKVIWSKAKNCYVVASEIARSHTKSATGSGKIGGVTRRSLLASLMALSLLCGGLGVASASLEVVDQSGTDGTVTIYTKDEVDKALDTKGAATDVETNKAAIADLKNAVGVAGSGLTKEVADQKAAIAANTKSIDTNKAAIESLQDDKLGKDLANSTFATKTELDAKANTDLSNLTADGENKIKNIMSAGMDLKADMTTVDAVAGKVTALENTVGNDSRGLVKDVNELKTQGNDLNNALGNKADKTELNAAKEKITANEGKITDLQKKTTGLSDDGKSLNGMNRVETDVLKVTGQISDGTVNTTLADIKGSMTQTETNKEDIANLKTTTNEQQAAIDKLNEKTKQISYADGDGTKISGVRITDGNIVGNGNSAITGLANVETDKIKTDSINGKSLTGTTVATEKEVKDVADAVKTETDERKAADTALEEKIAKNTKDIATLDGKVTTAQSDIQTNANNIQANSKAIADTNKRTGGIARNLEDTQTTIEGSVKVDNKGNVKDVEELSAKKITTTEDAVIGGDLKVTGETTLSGELKAEKDATFEKNVTVEKDLTVNGKLNVDKISLKNDELKNGKKHDSATTITADEISNLAKVTEQGNTTESQFTHNEKGTFNYAKDEKSTGEWKRATSNVTADGVSNKMTDSAGNTHTYYQTAAETKEQLVNGNKSNFEKKTAKGNTISITEKDAAGKPKSSLTNKQTVDGEKTSVTNKDSSSTVNQGADQIRNYVASTDGTKSSTEVKADGITNTSDGTITNDANHIENKANTMDTTVTGKATESYGELETTVNGNETHTVTGNQDIHVTGDQTTTITGNKKETVTENVTEDYKKDLTTTVGGNETHEVKGTKTETVEGKLTENFKGGQETNVTGDQTTNVSGTQTINATDINRNASSGMIDTVDNAYGTNKETKVAGSTTTEVSIKGTGESGTYIRGATEARDYIIKGTLSNSETKTVEKTSTEITDGNGNTSATIQDKTQISGSVTNGTSSAVSNVKADSIDTAVKEGTNTSLISQKKDSITSAVGNGTTSTVIQQGDKDITIASNGGTVGIVGKDIINNATDEITNTAGTKITDKVGNNTRVINQTSITDTVGTASRKIEDGKITDTAGDSTVTTENGKGTTFAKAGSTAYSTKAGAPTDTNIAGNHITTGRVDANELGVSDKDGDNTADFSVEAGEGKGVKASAGNGTTTGSLDVTAKEVGSSVKDDASGKGSTLKQRIDAIMGNVKTADGESEVTQKGDEINSKVGLGEATNSRVTQKKDLLEAAVTDGTNYNISNDTANASAKVLSGGTKVNKLQDNLDSSEKTITNGTYTTSKLQTALDITNTAKDGTITNDAKNIVNNATGDMTNTVGGKLTTTVTGQATENFKGGLKTDITGEEIHTVTGNQTNKVTGKQTNTVEGGQENIISGGQINNITGDQTTTISGTQTTTATDINRNASSGMIDTIDNAYGTNTETKVAGKTTTDVSIKGTGEKGQYIRGANESRDYLIKGTLKNSETKTAEATSTKITDGNGKTSSTIQDVTQISGSVTDGTNTSVSNVKANSIDSAVTDGSSISTINQKKNSITSQVTDGTTITKTEQDTKNITNTAKDGTITNDAKDIVNNASGNMTNTVGGDLKTTVSGNELHEVTGKQTNKIDGDQENTIGGNQTTTVTGDISNKAENITNEANTKLTDKVGENTRVLDSEGITDTVGGSTFKQRIDKIMMESKDVSIKAEETLTNEAKVITNKASEVINNEAVNINNTATGIITSKASEIKNQADKLISNKVGENTWENMENGKITTSIKDGAKQNLTQSDAVGTTQSTVDGGKSTVTIQNADGLADAVTDGTNTSVQNQTASAIAAAVKDGAGNENASVANATTSVNTIKSGSKANTVISTADGTSFINSEAAAPVGDGTEVKTTIKGNTITTGKVTMDYAEVMKDLGVRGNANIAGKTTTGSLEVKGESKLTGDVTMESNATVKKDLTVEGNTNLKNTKVDGTLDVTQKATFGDSVSIAKDLSVDGNATIKGDVTAKSYKVGDKTYISAAGINANDQKITNVADGSISEGSKDAVNGGQLYGMKNDLEGKVNKVGANAAAMANLHPMEFDPDSKWNIAAAIGNYGSETAAALGAFYRPNDDVMVNLSTAFGTGENMVGGGVSVRLGKGGNKLSREENNALKDQVDNLTARMDALLSVLNPNMSKDFPDVPENHWAYEAVSRLAGNDIVQGYPDGEFHGERTMTRYEMAEIIYNALSRGAEAEKELVEEFKPELQAMAASEKATAERAEG